MQAAQTFAQRPDRGNAIVETGSRPVSDVALPSWVRTLERRHFHAGLFLTLVVTLISVALPVPSAVELALVALGVAFVGLPHGALDHVVAAELLRPRWRAAWPVPFAVGYLAVGAAVVACWLVSPTLWLVGFLVVAAGHFGVGDVRRTLAPAAGTPFAPAGVALDAAARAMVLFGPLLTVHADAVSALFASLLPIPRADIEAVLLAHATTLRLMSAALVGIHLAHHFGGWVGGVREHAEVVFETGALLALFVLASPLLSFLVYFCFWHSPRHSIRQAAALDSRSSAAALRAFFRQSAPMTLAAIGLAAVGFAWAARAGVASNALLAVIFVGLSALTFPHVGLAAVARWRARDTEVCSASEGT